MKPASVMIVENNADLLKVLRHVFIDRGYLIWTCPAPEYADSIVDAARPDVILLNIDLSGPNALALIDSWKSVAPSARIIVESDREDAELAQEAKDHGAIGFFLKPLPLGRLFELLDQTAVGSAAVQEPIKPTAA